ncbi:MAG: helix-turn-helix domain-containing protein [Propionibacteriaceae bacterium]
MPHNAAHPDPHAPTREWLSLQDAAAIYDISVDTLRRSISKGKLPASRFGARLIRVRIQDLERLHRAIPMGDSPTDHRRAS